MYKILGADEYYGQIRIFTTDAGAKLQDTHEQEYTVTKKPLWTD